MIFITPSRSKSVKLLLAILGGAALFLGVKGFIYSKPTPDSPVMGILKPIFSVETMEKKIALTFDVSWGNKLPGQILDILRDKSVQATFFVSGPWVAVNRELARRMVEEGHEIGNLGYSYVNMTRLSAEEVLENIDKSHRLIIEASGSAPKLFRPPNGHFNDLVLTTAMEQGYLTVIWSIDTFDSLNPDRDAILKRTLDKAKEGAIILMHANDTSLSTREALPGVIDGLAQQGYEFVTVSGLLGHADQD